MLKISSRTEAGSKDDTCKLPGWRTHLTLWYERAFLSLVKGLLSVFQSICVPQHDTLVFGTLLARCGCKKLFHPADLPHFLKLNVTGHRKYSYMAWCFLNCLKGALGNKGSYCSFSLLSLLSANNLGFLFTVFFPSLKRLGKQRSFFFF